MNDNRYILVIADDSPEMEIALEYACARSKKTSRKIIIATFYRAFRCANHTGSYGNNEK